MDRVMLVYSTR